MEENKVTIETIRADITPIYEKWRNGNNLMGGFDAMYESYLAGYRKQLLSQKAEVERLREALELISRFENFNNQARDVALNALTPNSKS